MKTTLIFAFVALFLVQAHAQQLWGAVTVRNQGGYTTKFSVTYKLNDNYQTTETGSFPVGQARTLPIPPEAQNILIQSYVNVFINNWSVIFADTIASASFKCYQVSGTTLNTKWNSVDC